jgi:ADP-L-glycero-D-manno-heptose 6-epimerase
MIIVTGGAGLIGSAIVKALNKQGNNNIIIVDNLNHAHKKNNLSLLQYNKYYDKHIFLKELPALQNITAILHQGACSSTTETNETYLQQNNVDYSITLLNYCIEKSIPFIYASSASVYGNGEKGFDDASNDYYPINGYANSKLAIDKYVTSVLLQQKISNKVIGLRYFNVYGNGEAHKQHMSSVVFKFYEAYNSNKPIQLFEGSNKILRDFISVEDIVAVNLFCLQQKVVSGVYNVGTGKAASFLTLAQCFQTQYQSAVLEEIPFPEHLKNKYQYFTEAKMEKLISQGYSNKFLDIKEGVQLYLQQLQNG